MLAEEKKEAAQRLLELAVLLEYPTLEVADRCGLKLEDLESRYIRLFVNSLGGVAAPPYAGCFLERKNRLEFMSQFSGFCLENGLAIDMAQPPDYIPMMVEVLVMLLSEDAQQETLHSLIADFYCQWPEAFASVLREHDDVGIYVTVAEEFCSVLREIETKNESSTVADRADG